MLGVSIGRRRWAAVEMQQQRWAAPAAEEHAMIAPASASSKPRAWYYNIGISVGEDGKRGRIQCKGCTLEAMARKYACCGGCGSGGGADTTKIVDKARARGQWRWTSTGKARAMQRWHHPRGDKGEVKWLGKGARQQSLQAGQKGVQRQCSAKNKLKNTHYA